MKSSLMKQKVRRGLASAGELSEACSPAGSSTSATKQDVRRELASAGELSEACWPAGSCVQIRLPTERPSTETCHTS